MTDSSLYLIDEGFYSIVSKWNGGCVAADYLLKLQESIKRSLEKRTVSASFRGNLEHITVR